MIVLIGSNGRMGKCLQKQFVQNNIKYLSIDAHNRNLLTAKPGDVVVDFSCADALKDNLAFAKQYNIPIVIGTTNHNSSNKKLMQQYKKYIPIFYSANMSILFNVFNKILPNLKVLKAYDFVIEEVHHKGKLDRPSGSAKLLKSTLKRAGIQSKVYSIRAGSVSGTHSLNIYANGEVLKIEHMAQNRDIFAVGTLKAIQFIKNKKCGLFGMEDLLKIDSL